ncbi:MAG: molecular chaperone DnaK [Cytophagales bacterium]
MSEKTNDARRAYGIDLGTTNSAVAIIEVKDPVIIPNAEGNRTTPSVVSFAKGDSAERKFGMFAKRQAVVNPANTISSVKRFIGKNYTEVSDIVSKMSYKVVPSDKDACMIQIGERRYPPQEISAMFLRELVRLANDYLKQDIKDVVITVPAYFNDQERNATKEAGRIAGLNVLRILNEPTAAALAYGLKQQQGGDKKSQKIAVYDFGGGTFDISILECAEGVFEVKATNGDAQLGGDNLDERLIEYVIKEFRKEEGVDLTGDKMALQRLREALEKAKKELSFNAKTEINLPFITATPEGGPKHLVMSLTRSKFESLCEDLIDRTFVPCQKALDDAGITKTEIDEVILVGGSTRIPKVVADVEKFFDKKPTKGINPDEVVAIGAAVQAGIIKGSVDHMVLLDVTPISLGIEVKGGLMHKLIKGNTNIPTEKAEIFSTAEDQQSNVQIKVYQGERDIARYNKMIGQFALEGIKPAPRGVPQIEVTFDIDVNGILSVSAKDKDSGKSQNVRIESASLSEEDIKKMKAEAEAHAEGDRKEKEKVNTLNKAESTLFQVEKMLKEDGDAVDAEKRKKLDAFVEDLKKAHAAKEAEKVEALMKENEILLGEIYQLLFAAKSKRESAKNEQQDKSASGTQSQNDVKDVDFEEVKEDENEKK